MKTIRIGSGAGYAGDRMDPAVELMEKGNLDYIIFECLAERTIAIGQQDREKNPDRGYNRLLKERMEQILPLAAEKRFKVITNMGAANPRAAAEAACRIAERLHVTGLKIACVTGDDITDRLEQYSDYTVLETGKPLREMGNDLISANVYLGAEGITEALQNGADIVITGRVSDPALTVGPLVYEFGWNLREHPAQMGQAVLAGHLLECAGQVTGGYYADPGYKDVPDLHRLGFPLIEIGPDGAFVVTKVEGSGGLVSTDTCKEQMIYEIHDPADYLTPDAAVDFSHVTFTSVGENRVMAEHAYSHGRPDTLKVSVGYKDCFIGEGEISYGGGNCLARAQLAADIIEKRMGMLKIEPEEYRVDYIGLNSLYRDKIAGQMKAAEPGEIRLRISGRFKDSRSAGRLANEVEALYTNGPAGGGGAVTRVAEVISVCSIFIPREDVEVSVSYMEV